jgi:predicted transcriptional regulator
MMLSVSLKPDTYQRIMSFANRTGQTASAAANEAIEEWMESHGEPILHSLDRQCGCKSTKKPAKVLVFPRLE